MDRYVLLFFNPPSFPLVCFRFTVCVHVCCQTCLTCRHVGVCRLTCTLLVSRLRLLDGQRRLHCISTVIFIPEELINRNCTGTRGKGQLDAAKMCSIRKYAFKLFPCMRAQEHLVWRKRVIAINEFLRRKKRERQD